MLGKSTSCYGVFLHLVVCVAGKMRLFNGMCNSKKIFRLHLKPRLGIGFQQSHMGARSVLDPGLRQRRRPRGAGHGRGGSGAVRCSTVTLAGRPGSRDRPACRHGGPSHRPGPQETARVLSLPSVKRLMRLQAAKGVRVKRGGSEQRACFCWPQNLCYS